MNTLHHPVMHTDLYREAVSIRRYPSLRAALTASPLPSHVPMPSTGIRLPSFRETVAEDSIMAGWQAAPPLDLAQLYSFTCGSLGTRLFIRTRTYVRARTSRSARAHTRVVRDPRTTSARPQTSMPFRQLACSTHHLKGTAKTHLPFHSFHSQRAVIGSES